MTASALTIAQALEDANAPMPRIALVLGSGLGALAEAAQEALRFEYKDLPDFPDSGVSSHQGALIIGRLGGVQCAILAGRAHYYEQGDAKAMQGAIQTLRQLGVRTLLLTNAAGSLREEAPPGALMLISDHINWSGLNPLIGEADDDRFVSMENAYHPDLRADLHEAAKAVGQELQEGVYMWFSGPSFETPAEVRMARKLGADAVGMSTVPECILARHAGMRVAAISTITNFGAGMRPGALSHAETKHEGAKAARTLEAVILKFMQRQGEG